MHASNFMRFYIPSVLAERHHADRLMYLDGDTLVVHDVATLYDAALTHSLHAVASAKQLRKNCVWKKMINVKDHRLQGLDVDGSDECLTASVMIVDVKRWRQRNITAEVERWIASNVNEKLYYLGSMPPLMLALGREWERLPTGAVVDMKGIKCCPKSQDVIWRHAVVLHPVKDVQENALGDYTTNTVRVGNRM